MENLINISFLWIFVCGLIIGISMGIYITERKWTKNINSYLPLFHNRKYYKVFPDELYTNKMMGDYAEYLELIKKRRKKWLEVGGK